MSIRKNYYYPLTMGQSENRLHSELTPHFFIERRVLRIGDNNLFSNDSGVFYIWNSQKLI